MKIKRHTKKSGRKIWKVVEGNFWNEKILYTDINKKACEHYIKLHSNEKEI